MAKKRFQAEQIIGKLREAEVEISNGPRGRPGKRPEPKKFESWFTALRKPVCGRAKILSTG